MKFYLIGWFSSPRCLQQPEQGWVHYRTGEHFGSRKPIIWGSGTTFQVLQWWKAEWSLVLKLGALIQCVDVLSGILTDVQMSAPQMWF